MTTYSITVTADSLQALQEIAGLLSGHVQVAENLTGTTGLVVPPAPAPTPEAGEVADPNGKLDEWGVQYDANIHSSNGKMNETGPAAGRWMKKRGVPDALYDQPYAGRTRGAAAPAPTPAPAPAPTPAPAPAPTPAPAPAGATRDVSGITTPNQLVAYITELQKRKDAATLNPKIQGVYTTLGYAALPQLIVAATKDANVVPTAALLIAELEAEAGLV